jgi:hypothetical protein
MIPREHGAMRSCATASRWLMQRRRPASGRSSLMTSQASVPSLCKYRSTLRMLGNE